MNNNKVKLVIWDLDEVIWEGSLVEGTLKHSERINITTTIIKYLNSHGIINSVCSKNNFEDAKKKLIELDLWDYFVFPKIKFSSKGSLIKQIIKECNFLPKNVLFVDDDNSNRKEAQYYNEGIMVEDEDFVFKLFNDDRFKDLKEKNRLEDYKILEEKNKELDKFKGDNKDFLRSLNIECAITKINNIDNKIVNERIFELINRTNQLNYTKNRLNNLQDVLDIIQDNDHSVYIVEGKDKFAYYDIIGVVCFKLTEVIHFCFSCRMMDTMIENFVFKLFDYPNINIKGNVTIPLDKNIIIDWIKPVPFINRNPSIKTEENSLSHILFRGACDIQPLIPYLRNLPIVEDLNNLKNDTSIYHLTQNLSDEQIKIITEHTNNLYNKNTFEMNVTKDTELIVYSLGDTYYQKILKHKDTNILINNSRSGDDWKEKNADKNKFISISINEAIFEEHLKIFLNKYNSKKIIFINCPEVDSDDNLGPIFKKLNDILDKYIDNKSIFLLDIRKIITNKDDLRDEGKYITHYKRESYYTISVKLEETILPLIKEESNLYFSEKYMTIYDKENLNVIINNDMAILKIINSPKNNYGISFFYNNKNNNLNFEFECKIKNKEDKIFPRLYTGKEWIQLDNEIGTEFKKFTINCEFNFKSNSQWRLSSTSKLINQEIYIKYLNFY